MKCYVDIEGTIPAKVGDRVALARSEDLDEILLEQRSAALRPKLKANTLTDEQMRADWWHPGPE